MAASSSSSSSSLISNNIGITVSDDRSLESKKKRRKKNPNSNQNQTPRWRSADEQQIYSTKLLDALRQVRRSTSSSSSSSSSTSSTSSNSPSPPTGRVVREAADRALAVTAKGRTRWSRAILTNKLRLKFKKKKLRVITGCNSRSKKLPGVGGGGVHQLKKQKRLLPLQRKVRVLGRIVPGCRKLSFPVLLEETTDYIAALQMQVRTMTVLTELLSSAGSIGSANNTQQLGSNQSL